MEGRGLRRTRPFIDRLIEWGATPGAVRRDGTIVAKPAELEQAELIEALAKRYHKSPAEIGRESVGLLRHVAILTYAGSSVASAPSEEEWLDIG